MSGSFWGGEVWGVVGKLSGSCRGVVGEFSGSFRGVFGGLSGDPGNRFPFIFIHGSHLGPFAIFLGPFAKIWGNIHLQGCWGLSGVVGVAGFDKAPNCHQERKVSKERKQMVKKMKKEIGLTPYGNLQPYSTSELPEGLAIRFNSRERESLDIQHGLLEVT